MTNLKKHGKWEHTANKMLKNKSDKRDETNKGMTNKVDDI